MKVESLKSRADLKGLEEWLPAAFKRFGIAGYGRTIAPPMTMERFDQLVASPDRMYACFVDAAAGKGVALVMHSRWEEGVIGKTFARIPFLAADSYDIAVALIDACVRAFRDNDVVLATASSGTSPGFIQVALGTSGFYVGSQAMTLCADLETLWKKLSKVPESKDVRLGKPSDADAVARIGSTAFTDARFTADPHFPKEWGNRLYADWARQLLLGDEHDLYVLDQGGKILGFANKQHDVTKSPKAPGLFVVDRDAQGSGLGPVMLRRVIQAYREDKAEYPLIGTEKGYSAVNTMFFRLGMWLEDMNIVYHWTPRKTQ